MMFASPTRRLNLFVRLTAIVIAATVCTVLAASVAYGQAQANAADPSADGGGRLEKSWSVTDWAAEVMVT